MEPSILISTKKMLNIEKTVDAFDLDICTYINSAISVLNQLGVTPLGDQVVVQSQEEKWEDLKLPQEILGLVKTYIPLKVRLSFDPPPNPALTSFEKQIAELEGRISMAREVKLYG